MLRGLEDVIEIESAMGQEAITELEKILRAGGGYWVRECFPLLRRYL